MQEKYVATSTNTGSTSPKKSKNKWVLPILFVLILVAIVSGVLFLVASPKSETKTEDKITIESQTQELTPTNTPAPTSEPIDKSQIKIKILNGTGIAKEASFLQEKLEDLGYSQIETGNAEEQNHESTTVTFKSSVPKEVRNELETELKDTYQTVNTTESDSEDTDILIITGLRSGQTLPTATPTTAKTTPTPEETTSPTPSPSLSPTPTP